jgi:Permuted papain-like amidase enzyme, YaeF/YiiX, C92 family
MQRRIGTLVKILFAVCVVIYGWLALTSVSAKDLPPLRNGDIVFQTSRGSQSSAILLASLSAYSHMGIVELGKDGAPLIVEAVGPVKSTALDDWIKRGLGGRVAIKRLTSLTPSQGQRIIRAAHEFDGLPYDLYFMSTTDQIYCSELVRLAFSNGASITLGTIQRAKELYLDNIASKRLIKKRWQKHPLCQNANAEKFESCYAEILEQELVTPASIYNDPKLDLVYSNYGPFL